MRTPYVHKPSETQFAARHPEPANSWDYWTLPSQWCTCGLEFSERVAKLHAERTKHELFTRKLVA